MKPFDAILKQMLKDYGPDWGAWLAPRLGLSADGLEAIDPDLSTVQATPDKVFRLAAGAGLLHLEVQSSWDGELADRLLFYNVLLHHRHGGPVFTTVILLRPEANARSLTGVVSRTRPDGRAFHRFEYDVIRVWELSADALLAGRLGTAPLGLLTNDAAGRMPDLVRRLAERVDREEPNPELQTRLLVESFILTGLRYDREEMRPLFMGVQNMRESSTYQGILEEGEELGLEKGREQGREQGQLIGLRTALVAILERKFASLPPAVEARVTACTDAKRLQAATVLAAMAPTLAEFERDLQL